MDLRIDMPVVTKHTLDLIPETFEQNEYVILHST